MIEDFYTRAFTVTRLTRTSGKMTSDYQEVATFNGHLQQASQLENIAQDLADYISHSVWCAPGTDIEVSDIIHDGEWSYSVHAIQDNSYVGVNKHLEVLVERTELVSA